MDFHWKVDSSGLRRFRQQWPDKLDQFGRAVSTEIVGDVKISMTLSPADTSKSYVRGVNRVHHPSFPGNPPRVDMGTLRASIRWIPDGKLRWRIGDGVDYGADLEFGTPTIAARPWLTPVFMKWIIADYKAYALAFPWEAGLG